MQPGLPKRGGILNLIRAVPEPGPPPYPIGDSTHLEELHACLTISQADLHFRRRVFAVNLERDELRASIERRTSVRPQELGYDTRSSGVTGMGHHLEEMCECNDENAHDLCRCSKVPSVAPVLQACLTSLVVISVGS